MIDIKTDQPLYLPQYTAESFCFSNPEYKKAYQDYFRCLIAETGIDGLSADNAVYFAGFNACGCQYCKAEFKNRTNLPVEEFLLYMPRGASMPKTPEWKVK